MVQSLQSFVRDWLMTSVALFTDSSHIATLTERPAVVAVDTGVVHIEESPTGDTLEVFRVPGLTEGLDRVTEYEATAGSTARDEPLLVIHLTVQQAVLLEDLTVPQSEAALGAGEVRLVPVGVTGLHSFAEDLLVALGADHQLLVLLHIQGLLSAQTQPSLAHHDLLSVREGGRIIIVEVR